MLIFGAWFLIAPQASLGLQELRWMSHHVFPGETLVGVLLITLGYLLIGYASRALSRVRVDD